MIRFCARFVGPELPDGTVRPVLAERSFMAPDDASAMDWLQLAWTSQPDAEMASLWDGERMVALAGRPPSLQAA